jgi:HEAT repeat protein
MRTKLTCLLLSACLLSVAAFADVQQTVNDLIPKLAAAKMEDRYAPQMELQSLALATTRPGAELERLALAKVLAARAGDDKVPQPARVWLVRQLEYIGGGESVSTLTALLKSPDAELKDCARRALEKNSAPAASQSLRAALKQGGGTSWEIGLIQSLGQRRDADAVRLIEKALSTPETAPAAASALAKIHTQPALKALWAAFDQKLPVATDALLEAANRLLAEGNAKQAEPIYSKLGSACDGVQWRAAALNGLAKAAPEKARKLIPEAFSSTNPKLQEAALSAARIVYGKDLSKQLAGLFPNLAPSAKLLVLRAFDASAEPQVIAAASDSDPAVQVAAVETLGRIGSPASVPLLLATAGASPSPLQKAAWAALATISGPGVDATLARAAAQGATALRAVAIRAWAEHSSAAAAPVLLKYAGESDRNISAASCVALANVGTDAELEPLAKLTLAGTASGAEDALRAVATRSRNKAAAAEKVITLAQAAEPAKAVLLFDTLSALGGSPALTFITKTVSSSDAEASDAALRALAGWSEFAAVNPLLAIASTPDAKPLHKVLALQGIARLVRSADKEAADARLQAVAAGMKAATRDEEKKLLLSAYGSIHDARAAEALKPFLSVPELKSDAGLAVLSLSQSLLKKDKTTAKNLAQAVKAANISDDLNRRADALLKK